MKDIIFITGFIMAAVLGSMVFTVAAPVPPASPLQFTKKEVILFTRPEVCPPCRQLECKLTPERIEKLKAKYDFKIIDLGKVSEDEADELISNHKIWGIPLVVIVGGDRHVGSDAVEFLLKESE